MEGSKDREEGIPEDEWREIYIEKEKWERNRARKNEYRETGKEGKVRRLI